MIQENRYENDWTERKSRAADEYAMCAHSFGKVRDDFSMKCCPYCDSLYLPLSLTPLPKYCSSSCALSMHICTEMGLHSICCVVNLLDDIFHG